MKANIVNHEQGSAAWLAFRKGKLSASKASTIMGFSPYQTPFSLWEEELGLREPQTSSPHMQRGLDIEDAARDWFHSETFTVVKPAVVQHSTTPAFIASLDGMSNDGEVILEIKNNRKELHELARKGEVCDMHKTQMMHQMYVCDLQDCYYLSYREGDPLLLKVKRDNDFITDMVAKELEFKQKVDDLIPPELSERDYEDLSHDRELEKDIVLYNTDLRALNFLKERLERKKSAIMERIGNKNAKGTGWKVTKYTRQGNVNYDAILSHYKIDTNVEQFRKPSSTSYRITVG